MKATMPQSSDRRYRTRIQRLSVRFSASLLLVLFGSSIYNFWFNNERLILEIFDRYPTYALKAEDYSPRLPVYDFHGIKTFTTKTNLYRMMGEKPDVLENKILKALPGRLKMKAEVFIQPVLHLAEKYKVDPIWAMAIMWTESHFRHNAISRVGARGPMQIMPGTHKYLTRYVKRKKIQLIDYRFDLNDTSLRNLEFGMIYLRYLLKRFDNNFIHATVAYNMGPNRVRSRLSNSRPVGNRNHYLNKVRRAYSFMLKRLNRS